MNATLRNFDDAMRQSVLVRLVAIGLLIMVLLIPAGWIDGLTQERRQRRDSAVSDVSSKWGEQQTIVGPVLIVPYTARWTTTVDKKKVERSEVRYLRILPERLQVRAHIESQTRYRGIYAVPVYQLTLDVSGEVSRPADLAPLDAELHSVDWARAELSIGISDARAIQSHTSVDWAAQTFEFQPGTGVAHFDSNGIYSPITNPFPESSARFAFRLVLNGSSGVYFAPVGKQTSVSVESDWPSPSFQGDWLPQEHSQTAQGFSASWQIPYLGRNQPQLALGTSCTALAKPRFGVDLFTAIDEHRMAERSVKYAQLFLILTFTTIWLIEVMLHLRVHPIQYLLIGAGECIFYLLELSLAEQFGFAAAYTAASIAIVGLIAFYTAAVLRGIRPAGTVTATIGLLYAYLYVVLTNEDYALLLGSLALFTALAIIMFVTRGIDWYHTTGELQPAEEGLR